LLACLLACLLANKIIQTTKEFGRYFTIIWIINQHTRVVYYIYIGAKLLILQTRAKIFYKKLT
jgi:hypothetical protein